MVNKSIRYDIQLKEDKKKIMVYYYLLHNYYRAYYDRE